MITIYSKKNCSSCRAAKRYLTDAHIPFQELMLDEDFTTEFIKDRFPTAKTYPIAIVDGYYVGGASELKEHIATDVDPRKLLNEENI